MYEGKERSEWSRISFIVTTYLNCNRAKGKSLIEPDTFNPYAIKKEKEVIHDNKIGFEMLKTFVKKKGVKNGNDTRSAKQ